MTILIIAEHDNKQLKIATANIVTAAITLAEKVGSDVALFVAGKNCQAVTDEAAKIQGISKVFVSDCDALAQQLPENLAPMLSEFVKQNDVSHVMFAATTQGKNVSPCTAALLDVAQISEITDVIDADTFIRPIYAGNALVTIKSSDAIKVITIRGTAFAAAELSGGAAEVVTLDAAEDKGLSHFISEEVIESDRPELTSAKTIISGGRGMQNGDNFILLERVADKIGAAVGASRAAVDSGFVSNDMQVGQTGKIVAPDLYIAVGISGAIQHLAGMKDSKVIVAINKDDEAPIFNIADYSLQADLFDALPQLETLL